MMLTWARTRTHKWIHCFNGIGQKLDAPPYSEWMTFSKMVASIGGGHLEFKEQLWLADPTAILEESFAFYLRCTIPRGYLRDKLWMQIDKNIMEMSWSQLKCTLKAALVSHHYDPIPNSVTLSWHWANQSLPYTNNAEGLTRKWQVSIISHWLDLTPVRTHEFESLNIP